MSYDIDKSKDREVKGLLEAMDQFKIKKGLIITQDLMEHEVINGKQIEFIPLWRWLLD